ncbi:MAG: hypothetical protein ABW048_03680 [Sphingobium sp.]
MIENGTYENRWDDSQSILIAELNGFWTLDVVAAWKADLSERLGENDGPFDMLGDIRRHSIQTKEVMEAMTEVGRYLKARGLRRGAALVGDSALVKMQVARTVNAADLFSTPFNSEAEALAWLRAE